MRTRVRDCSCGPETFKEHAHALLVALFAPCSKAVQMDMTTKMGKILNRSLPLISIL